MDPFTAMAAATTAYKGIKKAIEVGKEISSMGSTLSSWSKAVSDLDFLEQKAQKPPMYKMFSDTQSNALEIWSQKQKLKEMREELRSHISFVYGPSAWDEIVRIEAQQRKEQRQAVYDKQEALDNLINAVIIGLIVLAGIGSVIVAMYLIGSKQGKW
jgi:flavin-dependent dehydrogenase|tara:strand:+ start:1145 stop:1615 length:471 start_codon:yes stop_codon:yes gene_type:complete